MKRWQLLCLALGVSYFPLVMLLFSRGEAAPAPRPAWTTEATVVEVYDGDTVVVEVKRRMRVRLLDCWAPETRTKDAEEKKRGMRSRDQLRTMLPPGSSCILQVPNQIDLGKSFTFGRVLGHLWTDRQAERSVSEQMVADGFATKTKQRKPKK